MRARTAPLLNDRHRVISSAGMFCRPCCISCNSSIGDVAAVFDLIRHDTVQAAMREHGVTAANLPIDPAVDIELRAALDDLCVFNECCRTHLLSAMKFIDYY